MDRLEVYFDRIVSSTETATYAFASCMQDLAVVVCTLVLLSSSKDMQVNTVVLWLLGTTSVLCRLFLVVVQVWKWFPTINIQPEPQGNSSVVFSETIEDSAEVERSINASIALQIAGRRRAMFGLFLDIPFIIAIELALLQTGSENSSSPVAIDFTQLEFCAVVLFNAFAHSASYIRNSAFFSTKAAYEKVELKRVVAEESSELDSFHGVTKKEVFKVLALQRLARRATADTVSGVCSDVNAYAFVKVFRDSIQGLKTYRKWIELRKKLGADDVRKEILLNDYAFNEMHCPTQQLFNFCTSGACYDARKGKLVFLGDVRPGRLDLELLQETSSDQFAQRIVYLYEFVSMLLEHLSRSHKRIVQMVIIINCKGIGLKSIRLLNSKTKAANAIAGLYPSSLLSTLVLFGAVGSWFSGLHPLLETVTTSFLILPATQKGYQTLHGLVSPSVLPPALRKFSNDSESEVTGKTNLDHTDPWGLDAFHFLKISDEIGKVSRLLCMHGITHLEVNNVSKMESILRLRIPTSDFKRLPSEVVGLINLLRVLRHCKNNISVAVDKMLDTIKFREQQGLDEINTRIKEENRTFQDIPDHAAFVHAFKSNPLCGRDDDKYKLVCTLGSVKDLVSSELHAWSQERIQRYLCHLYEFYSILLDTWSYRNGRIYEWTGILDFSTVNTASLPLVRRDLKFFLAAHREVRKRYTFVQRSNTIYWGVPGAIIGMIGHMDGCIPYRGTRNDVKKVLAQYSSNVLPTYMGGSVDPYNDDAVALVPLKDMTHGDEPTEEG